MQTSGALRRENARYVFDVIARSAYDDEAIHSFFAWQWIASLALAMTGERVVRTFTYPPCRATKGRAHELGQPI